jgi:hypothetical protein
LPKKKDEFIAALEWNFVVLGGPFKQLRLTLVSREVARLGLDPELYVMMAKWDLGV